MTFVKYNNLNIKIFKSKAKQYFKVQKFKAEWNGNKKGQESAPAFLYIHFLILLLLIEMVFHAKRSELFFLSELKIE